LINFGQIIEVEYFSFLLKKFWNLTNLVLRKIHEIFFSRMLGNISGNFGNFSQPWKVIKLIFFISTQKNWEFWKNTDA